MNIFDLLFVFLFFLSFGVLLRAAFLGMRRQRARARTVLERLMIGFAAYFCAVIVVSIVLPRRVVKPGDPICFDDWCIAVRNVSRIQVRKIVSYEVQFQLSSRARRVPQRETDLAVYATDESGNRFEPDPDLSAKPFDVVLQPAETAPATRVFRVPADIRNPGLVITHEGGFPIRWLIIGDESWFRKPTLIPLPA